MIAANAGLSGRVRPLAWGGSALLVLAPLLGMKLADVHAWAPEDLPAAFVMIAAVGLAFEFALRVPSRWTYRAGVILAVATAFLLVCGNLAVGFAGSEDNAINRVFLVVPVVALAGGAATGFRAAGLARALAATAFAQVLAAFAAGYDGFFTGPLTVAFAGLWLAGACLFHRSSREAGLRSLDANA